MKVVPNLVLVAIRSNAPKRDKLPTINTCSSGNTDLDKAHTKEERDD